MTRPVALFRDQRGASAAEFALVLPLLLILLLGMLDAGVIAGDPIPVGEFDYADCDDSDCDPCVGGDICDAIGYDSAAFANLVARMNYMYPAIESENVKVKYRNVGLGYAGDPNGPDVAPLVTVRLTGMTFQPITTLLFGLTMSMPDFRASLTLEDGSGTVAN
jgi:Flp pilus assembly pilin Flp